MSEIYERACSTAVATKLRIDCKSPSSFPGAQRTRRSADLDPQTYPVIAAILFRLRLKIIVVERLKTENNDNSIFNSFPKIFKRLSNFLVCEFYRWIFESVYTSNEIRLTENILLLHNYLN